MFIYLYMLFYVYHNNFIEFHIFLAVLLVQKLFLYAFHSSLFSIENMKKMCLKWLKNFHIKWEVQLFKFFLVWNKLYEKFGQLYKCISLLEILRSCKDGFNRERYIERYFKVETFINCRKKSLFYFPRLLKSSEIDFYKNS